ncbi:hypothetical protein WN944_013843 [Citrus x changshan-huyou]|uniref:Uncharacterized protein n=1 Tax=Citrus x changshan-huyou TaxID=2935761 RepID=A0AAP0M6V2_9ROSI
MLKIFPPKQKLTFIDIKINKQPLITLRSISSSSSSMPSTPSSSLSSSSSSSLPPRSNLTNAILNSKTPNQALVLFNSSSKKLNPTKSLAPFAATFYVLANAKLYKNARCLIKDLTENLLKSRKPQHVCYSFFNALNSLDIPKFNPSVFGTLIIAFSEMGHVEEALWVYRKIGVLPAIQACNALLNGLIKNGKFDSVWEFYEEMVLRGLVADVVTYGVLINCCCGQGDVMKALNLFDEMIDKGIEPTVVIYTILIHGLCNENKMVEAENMFRSMQECGVVPNLYTYNALMDGYCKVADVKRALEFYHEMLHHNLQPNVVTFGILMDGLCKVGELRAAGNFFVHMAKFGVFPNIFVYNCLIDGHCKAGNLFEAMSLCSEMGKFEISPDVFTYNILIKGLCGVGQLEGAEGLLQKMYKEGILANVVTYNSLIDGYCKEGDMEKALSVCSQMIENGVEPNVVTFSSLIDGQCKAGNIDAAMGLYTEMVIKSLVPDVVVFTALIDGLCKDGNMKEALRLYKEMLEAKINPSVFTISSLIHGLFKNGRISNALNFFLEKTDKTDGGYCSPNHVMYAAIIQALCYDGQILKASKLFSVMRSDNLRPDNCTYTIMLRGLLRAKRMLDVMMLLADMIKMGIVPDAVINQVMARGYQENGDLKSAFHCSEFLKNRELGDLKQKDTRQDLFLNRTACGNMLLRMPMIIPRKSLRKALVREAAVTDSNQYTPASRPCGSSASAPPASMDDLEFEDPNLFQSIPKFIAGAISGTLTGLFALAGAFTGAITGALAGRASNCGVLRGAGLGAIAGAVLSVELLEASRAYWCLERTGSRGSSSMADFVEDLLRGRFIEEQFTPAILGAYHWQVRIASMSYDVNDTDCRALSRGLTGESLKKLPCHVILDEIKPTQSSCCSICLQVFILYIQLF